MMISLNIFSAFICIIVYLVYVANARIIAIGSLFADLERAKETFMMAGIIENGKWVLNDVTVVMLGDTIGYGPNSARILYYLQQWQKEAKNYNSKLVLLLGPQEVYNINGIVDNVHIEDTRYYLNADRRAVHYGPDGTEGKFLRDQFSLIFIDDVSKTLFSHGYLNADLARKKYADINNNKEMLSKLSVGPVFMEYSPDKISCQEIDQVLRAKNVDRMVLGQQTRDTETHRVSVLCNGKLILASTGISRYHNKGIISYLDFTSLGLLAIYSHHDVEKIATLPVMPIRTASNTPSTLKNEATLNLEDLGIINPPPGAIIYAIGDLHGDYEATVQILQMLGLIDGEGHWIGGNSVLVQTGDVVDRGPSARRIWELLIRLKSEANINGGKVVCLLGNHELMNLQNQYDYVSEDDMAEFGGKEKRAQYLSSGAEIGAFLRNLNMAAKIGNSVFVHGGILPYFVKKFSIPEMNQMVRNILKDDGSQVNALEGDLLDGNYGPFWLRYFSDPNSDEGEMCFYLKEALALMNVERMVVGHTIQHNGKIGSRCEGRLVMIDLGISRWVQMSDKPVIGALKIVNGIAEAIHAHDSDNSPIPLPSNNPNNDEIHATALANDMSQSLKISDKQQQQLPNDQGRGWTGFDSPLGVHNMNFRR